MEPRLEIALDRRTKPLLERLVGVTSFSCLSIMGKPLDSRMHGNDGGETVRCEEFLVWLNSYLSAPKNGSSTADVRKSVFHHRFALSHLFIVVRRNGGSILVYVKFAGVSRTGPQLDGR